MSWDRLLWGVRWRNRKEKPFLLGAGWEKVWPPAYRGEPTRCLLFRTRKQARAWAAMATEKHKRHSVGWKFKAVRVTETIKEI